MDSSRPSRLSRRDLAYFLAEIRKRPLGFLLRKLSDEARKILRRFLASVGPHPYRSRRAATAPRMTGRLFPGEDLDAGIELLGRIQPEEIDALRAAADRIARGEIEVFSHALPAGARINWQSDFVSGRLWPMKFHTRFAYSELLDLRYASDVKVPWELSRLQRLPILALAYRRFGEERYLEALLAELEGWDAANPVGYGVNWVVGMEASLRAVNVIWAAEILAGTAGAERFAHSRLLPFLVEHGRFVYRNLEHSDVNGNHYTACLVGLLYLGLYLPELAESRRWVSFAHRELAREMPLQVYPDGVCHEGSIPYHRLVLELFLHAAVLARRLDLELGAAYWERLEKMFDFVHAYTKPNGEAPVWGDIDDGRVLTLGNQRVQDHRYLLAVGAALFDRAELLAASGPASLDAFALLERSQTTRLAEAWETARSSPGQSLPGSAWVPGGRLLSSASRGRLLPGRLRRRRPSWARRPRPQRRAGGGDRPWWRRRAHRQRRFLLYPVGHRSRSHPLG
jgi:hypothetical protein